MRASTARLTSAAVWELNERREAYGYELVDGELAPVTPASLPHARIVSRLVYELQAYALARRCGSIYTDGGFVLGVPGDPERLRFPDVAYVSSARLEKAGGEVESGYTRVVPDLVAEIDSPTNRNADIQQRVQDYLDAGVSLVWVVHPLSRAATLYRSDGSARLLRQQDSLDGEQVLPGLVIPLEMLVS